MENNNTMAVVLSFVLCSYVYQDAGGDIKAWISCDGWISSAALQSGQLFWRSKFILARRNVDLHYAIVMLLEDQTCLSKLPSCLITIWFQYPTFQVWVHMSQTTGCSLECCSLSLSLHTGVGFLKGLFISRITWSFFFSHLLGVSKTGWIPQGSNTVSPSGGFVHTTSIPVLSS